MTIDFTQKIKNTDKFREPAIYFKEHGFYTSAPRGTTAYKEYWDKERVKCLYGFTAPDGDYITGYNYWYLNYYQILLVDEQEVTNPDGTKSKRIVKKMDFPRFYDYDRFFFLAVEEAERQGKHLIVLKSRRKGYSYKIGAMLNRNFFLLPNSKGYALASEMEYLTKDGLLSKTWEGLDFVDEYTAWTKRRQKADTKMHKRASFVSEINGKPVEMGYKSEIIGVTLKNDPHKARGKAGKLIVFEEAGKLPDLLTAWQVCRPSVEQGSYVHGTMIAFGTGGEDGANFEGLKELFEEPEAYNCLAFEDIWDEEAPVGTTGGFFVPAWANLEGDYRNAEDKDDPDIGQMFMDEDGNSNRELALKFIMRERKKVIENASDRNSIDRHIAEHPVKAVEATLNLSANIFPKQELLKHLAFIRNNKAVKEFKQSGDLYFDENGIVKWKQATRPRDITKYRIKPEDDPRGQVVIWEHPVENPPFGLYIAGIDPYDHDQASSGSLGSCFIFKRFQSFESYYDMPVAEYTGRPDTADEFYENVRKLLLYYKATALYENEKKGIYAYFANKHAEHLLADQPGIINDIIKDSKVERRKGIHMNKPIKEWMELRIRDYLIDEYAEGKKNLTKIFSEPLLEELVAYNDTGNFDRVISFGLCIVYREELYNVHVKKKERESKRILLFDGPMTFNKDINDFNI